MNRFIQPIRNINGNINRIIRPFSSENLGRTWYEQNVKSAELRIRDYIEKEKKRLQEIRRRVDEQESHLHEIEQDLTGSRIHINEQNNVDNANFRLYQKEGFHPDERHNLPKKTSKKTSKKH